MARRGSAVIGSAVIDGTLHCSGGVVLTNNAVITGNGNGVVELGGTGITVRAEIVATASECTFTNGNGAHGGVFCNGWGGEGYVTGGKVNLYRCIFSNNSCAMYGGALEQAVGGSCYIESCSFASNSAVAGNALYIQNLTTATVKDSIFGENQGIITRDATLILTGSNKIDTISYHNNSGYVTISSGAIIDLTGNSNTTPINPGGGITFEQGGATVIASDGTPYMLGGVTVPKLGNTNTVNLNNGYIITSSGTSVSASNCVFVSGTGQPVGERTWGGAIALFNHSEINPDAYANATFTNCSFENCSASFGGAMFLSDKTSATLVSCSVASNNNGTISTDRGIYIQDDAVCILSASDIQGKVVIAGGKTSGGILEIAASNTINAAYATTADKGYIHISSGASITLTNTLAIYDSGARIKVLTGGCTVNGTVIPAGSYTKIVSSGGSAVAS